MAAYGHRRRRGREALAALRFVTGLAIGSEWSTGIALVASRVRATAARFVSAGARLLAWVFAFVAGRVGREFGGVSSAAPMTSSVVVIGLVLPWFMPETTGEPLPA